MAIFSINTPFNIELNFKTAPLIVRVAAWFLDAAFIGLYGLIMYFFIFQEWSNGRFSIDTMSELQQVLCILLILIPITTYHFWINLIMNGQSLGKMICRLKIINGDGGPANLFQYFLRWMVYLPNYFLIMTMFANRFDILFYFLVMVLLFSIPDIITLLINGKSQRMGDIASGTILVDLTYRYDINETIFMDVDHLEDYVPVYTEVMRLSDKDINGIRQMLNLKNNSVNDQYKFEISDRIEKVLGIKRKTDETNFLKQLLMDYNFLTQNK